MDKLIQWMNISIAPKINKIAKNTWIISIQDSIMTAMPFIFISSIVTMLSIVKEYVNWIPDFQHISNFTFGLFSLYLSYLIPMNILEKKNHRKVAKQAGLVGISLFLMICSPIFEESGLVIYEFSNFGAGGMVAALVSGLSVGFVMNLFSDFSFFKKESALPEFITVWFDTLIPILLIMLVGWILVFQFNVNIFEMIYQLFTPFLDIGQSFIGFVLLYFIGSSFLYSFGISTWVFYPIMFAITMQGINANILAVANGQLPTMINTGETGFLIFHGGGGSTLALNIMMLYAKSARLKLIGKASIVPSIFNINEPLVFGTPIAFNPTLMIPMWINGLLGPILIYLAMSIGLVAIPSSIFNLWYLPFPIMAFIVSGLSGLIFSLFYFVVSWIIYYPFFKIYDKQVLEEEKKEVVEV